MLTADSPAATALGLAEASAGARWAEIERWTLEACVLRAEGREAEAVGVLQERMPALIRDWSARCGLPRAAVQERLRSMFAQTQEFVARGVAQRRLITSELIARGRDVSTGDAARRLDPSRMIDAAAPAMIGLRRQVAVGDVVGMLDGLVEAERETRREAVWPLRSAATLAAARL